MGVLVFVSLWTCLAQSQTQTKEQKQPIMSSVAAPNGWRFECADEFVRNRGDFASPEDKAIPDTLNGIPVWNGGVFLLPGTPDSVLHQKGFLNVNRKSSSVMYDYYEATWPTTLHLDSLPLAIRQVRYSRGHASIPSIETNREIHKSGKTYCRLSIEVIHGLPAKFLEAYGVLHLDLPQTSKRRTYIGDWPKELNPSQLKEILDLRELPPKNGSDSAAMKLQMGRNELRQNLLPSPPPGNLKPNYRDGKTWVINAIANIDFPSDTSALTQLGMEVEPHITYNKFGSCYEVGVQWPADLEIDSLPVQLKGIALVKIGPTIKLDNSIPVENRKTQP
jgi:hypothetical protein